MILNMVTFSSSVLTVTLLIPWVAVMLTYAAVVAYQSRRQPVGPWLFPATATVASIMPLIGRTFSFDRLFVSVGSALFLWITMVLFRRSFIRRDAVKAR